MAAKERSRHTPSATTNSSEGRDALKRTLERDTAVQGEPDDDASTTSGAPHRTDTAPATRSTAARIRKSR